MTFRGLEPGEQWQQFQTVATDPRPRVQTGWPEMDALLHRRSLGPGTFCILAGRLHTRKTAVAVNLMVNMLRAGVPVGLVALDEATHMYVAKLASAASGISHSAIEESFTDPTQGAANAAFQQTYQAIARNLSITEGHRPTFTDLDDWLAVQPVKPRVVVIDYLSLMAREKFSGKDTDRIPRLAEDLAVWTKRHGLVTIALHQVGRQGDTSVRVHGHAPITNEQLKYGGEEQADIVWGTYRPALEPVGNMNQEQALIEGVGADEWRLKADRVAAFREDTFLQLIKNRPGTMLCPQGIRLRSVGDSQKMEVYP